MIQGPHLLWQLGRAQKEWKNDDLWNAVVHGSLHPRRANGIGV